MTDHEIARALLAARAGTPAPAGTVPADEAQAYRVQALVMAELGEIGGWKVGATSPDAPIVCAPMPAAGLFDAPHGFAAADLPQREVESEICFRMAADLPSRATPYTRDEVDAALATCHPGIEILQSRLSEPDTGNPLALLADFIQTGAYVAGAAIPGWREVDFATVAVTQTITGAATRTAVGYPAGEMIRLVVWLANTGAVWAGGLRAGQVVTCGSWTGKTFAPPGATATAVFAVPSPWLSSSLAFEALSGSQLAAWEQHVGKSPELAACWWQRCRDEACRLVPAALDLDLSKPVGRQGLLF